MNDEVAPTSLQTAPPSIPDTPPARRDSRFSAQRPQSSHTGGAVHSGARPAPFAGLRPPLAARLAAQLAEQRAARRAAPLAPSKRAVHQMGLGPLGPSFAPWECLGEKNSFADRYTHLTVKLAVQLALESVRRYN